MDISEKHKNAARENGMSGGVKTQEGKARSSLNATKHGIFSKITTSFDETSFGELYETFASEYGDETSLKQILLQQLTVTYIRILRCVRYESEVLRAQIYTAVYERKVIRPPKPGTFDSSISELYGDSGEIETTLIKEGERESLPEDFYSRLEMVALRHEPMLWTRFLNLIEILKR